MVCVRSLCTEGPSICLLRLSERAAFQHNPEHGLLVRLLINLAKRVGVRPPPLRLGVGRPGKREGYFLLPSSSSEKYTYLYIVTIRTDVGILGLSVIRRAVCGIVQGAPRILPPKVGLGSGLSRDEN